MQFKEVLIKSFPIYLSEIMPSTEDYEDYRKFLNETAMASVIDTYSSLESSELLPSLIQYLNRNATQCDLDLLHSLENQTNIPWSKKKDLLEDLQYVLRKISEYVQQVNESDDKKVAIEKLRKRLKISLNS